MKRQEVFRRRLRHVVDRVFAGNVNLAAAEIGFPQPTLHKILSGQTKESKDSTLTLLADRLGVSPAWFRGESDGPGGPSDVPRDLALLFLYHERRQRASREWLAGFKPESVWGKALKAAASQEIRWEDADSFWTLCLESAASFGFWPAEMVEMLRSRLEYETSRLRLAVEELRRAG